LEGLNVRFFPFRERIPISSIVDLWQIEPSQWAFELLNATTNLQRAKVDHGEAELFEQRTDLLFRVGIIT
jgi:hypothetical protein